MWVVRCAVLMELVLRMVLLVLMLVCVVDGFNDARDHVGKAETGDKRLERFVLVAGVTYFAGRLVANRIGRRTRTSIVGPVDRALGFGFGALKGLIFASLAFLLFVLFFDFVDGGAAHRPLWLRQSRTYPLLNATSASMADMIDRRRHGRPVFGDGGDNAAEPAR